MTSNASLELVCKDYFCNLNVLAQKITSDIENTKESYQHLWSTLNESEQKQVIDESLINPTIAIKYGNFCNKIPKHGYLYTYTWFSKSQLDLCGMHIKNKEIDTIYDKLGSSKAQNRNVKSNSGVVRKNISSIRDSNIIDTSSDILNKIKNKMSSYKTAFCSDEKQMLLINNNKITMYKSVILKPKNPPPPPPIHAIKVDESKALIKNEEEKNNENIPKTGFDFLDNW